MPFTSYYLDSREEHGSEGIVNSLGIRYNVKDFSNFTSRKITFSDSLCNQKKSDRGSLLIKEHKSTSLTKYRVISGTIYLDVRDTADALLRIVLQENDTIEISPELNRRFSIPTSSVTEIEEYYTTTDNISHRYSEYQDSISVTASHESRELVCELCRQFFQAGWVMGTGGSISIRYGNRIYMTPSGVQKERIKPDELYVLDVDGAVLCTPSPKPGFSPKLSDCSPLFLHAFKQRNAGAVLHSHHVNCNLATALFDGEPEFRISHQEMIKGLVGYGYFDELVIPIIENTAWEHELADCLGETIAKYPKASAVLVRRHGMYVWGATWEQAKRHAECLHYLFDLAVNMRRLGMGFLEPPKPVRGAGGDAVAMEVLSEDSLVRKRSRVEHDGASHSNGAANGHNTQVHALHYKHVVCDIEGTTTPITFVKDVLFPFAHARVADFLTATWESSSTVSDVKALYLQAAEDEKQGSALGAPSLSAGAAKATAIAELSVYVQWCIAKDRKIGALKQLQGHLWAQGYASREIVSVVYDDVPEFLTRARSAHVAVSIYSSGSREAQQLLFRHSAHGDLRPLLTCYFDTAVGHKREAASYRDILLTLGVDSPSEVLFVTDVLEEAQAAKQAGWDAVLAVRPGNAVLPAGHGFPTIHSFLEML